MHAFKRDLVGGENQECTPMNSSGESRMPNMRRFPR